MTCMTILSKTDCDCVPDIATERVRFSDTYCGDKSSRGSGGAEVDE